MPTPCSSCRARWYVCRTGLVLRGCRDRDQKRKSARARKRKNARSPAPCGYIHKCALYSNGTASDPAPPLFVVLGLCAKNRGINSNGGESDVVRNRGPLFGNICRVRSSRTRLNWRYDMFFLSRRVKHSKGSARFARMDRADRRFFSSFFFRNTTLCAVLLFGPPPPTNQPTHPHTNPPTHQRTTLGGRATLG